MRRSNTWALSTVDFKHDTRSGGAQRGIRFVCPPVLIRAPAGGSLQVPKTGLSNLSHPDSMQGATFTADAVTYLAWKLTWKDCLCSGKLVPLLGNILWGESSLAGIVARTNSCPNTECTFIG